MRALLMVILGVLFLSCTASGAIAQTLTSDQPDYAPGHLGPPDRGARRRRMGGGEP